MDSPTKEDLKTLSAAPDGPAVSLYIPTHRAGADTRENAIRFKNRVQEAEHKLKEYGLEDREAASLLGPASALIDDEAFWQQQADGFAMFLTDGASQQFRVGLELDELTVVGERYHLKPLMPLLSGDGKFYVLAASINKARLFEATRSGIHEVDLGDTPTSMAEATRFDDPERSLQDHSVSGSAPGGARPDVTYHGTGAGDDDKSERTLRYLRMLENGVTDAVNEGNAPLLFAGVDRIFSYYQEANHYNHLLEQHVSGNPDEWSEEEVHAKAWELVQGHFDKTKQEAMQRYKAVAHEETSSADLEDIVRSAGDARIDTLIVGVGEQRWGTYDRQSRSVAFHDEPQPGDEDLLDFAAVQTLLNGGTVYAVPADHVPDGGLAVATYRF